jgi:hypothetical protein
MNNLLSYQNLTIHGKLTDKYAFYIHVQALQSTVNKQLPSPKLELWTRQYHISKYQWSNPWFTIEMMDCQHIILLFIWPVNLKVIMEQRTDTLDAMFISYDFQDNNIYQHTLHRHNISTS